MTENRLRQLLRIMGSLIILATVLHAALIVLPAYITGAYRWEYSHWQIRNAPPTWEFVSQGEIGFLLFLFYLPFNGLIFLLLPLSGVAVLVWQHKLFTAQENKGWLIVLVACALFALSTLGTTAMYIDWVLD